MARCGRCGLWNQYPAGHEEQKYAGVCVWYQMRLHESDVWESRVCPDFFEKMPGVTALSHFDYKIKRDNLGDAYVSARRAKYLAYTSLTLSIVGLVWKILSP